MSRRILPGFKFSLGFTIAYLALLLLLPMAACLYKASALTGSQFLGAVWTPRTQAAYRFTLEVSLWSASAGVVLGLLVAWVLVRYEFPLKRVFDSLIDLPFALPTAVAGLVYSSLYVKQGWLGQFLVPIGIEGAYSKFAVVLVLTFLGLPFVVRAIQPVLETIDADTEEAAFLLGASRLQTFLRVIFPAILPATVTGFALSFARALGEYGSVVFVSGNMPFKTEIAPVLIVSRLEEFAYAEATAIAVVLLGLSLTMLLVINQLERWSTSRAT